MRERWCAEGMFTMFSLFLSARFVLLSLSMAMLCFTPFPWFYIFFFLFLVVWSWFRLLGVLYSSFVLLFRFFDFSCSLVLVSFVGCENGNEGSRQKIEVIVCKWRWFNIPTCNALHLKVFFANWWLHFLLFILLYVLSMVS